MGLRTISSAVRLPVPTISSALPVSVRVAAVAAGSVASGSLAAGSVATVLVGYGLDLGGVRRGLSSSGCHDRDGGTQGQYREKGDSCPAPARLACGILDCHVRRTPSESFEFDGFRNISILLSKSVD